MDTDARKHKSGQAIVEFCVGLVAMLAVVAGVFQLGRLGLARTDARVEATAQASAYSMMDASDSFRIARSYIYRNQEGGDQRSYSVDDLRLTGSADEVYDRILANHQPQLLRGYAPGNELAEMTDPLEMMAGTGLVQGSGSENHIPILPVVRRLFFNQPYVDIQVTAWSVRTGDLY